MSTKKPLKSLTKYILVPVVSEEKLNFTRWKLCPPDCIAVTHVVSFFLSPTSFYLTSLCRGLSFHVITHNDTTTVGRTPLDEGSARRRDLYLTTHNTRNRLISMPPAGFEPAILAGDRLQRHALDRSATEIGKTCSSTQNFAVLHLTQNWLVGQKLLETRLLCQWRYKTRINLNRVAEFKESYGKRWDEWRISNIAFEYNPKSRRDVGCPRERWSLWSRNRPRA